MTSQRELFGGAITMDLPSNLVDASDLRQVPDTQEVFLSLDSDLSFVVEILQRVDVNDGEDAAKFHFDSLAHDNSATSQEVLEIILPSKQQSASPPATPYAIFLLGKQEVTKFNSATVDHVQILVALYRVEAKGVDLLFTMNVPQAPAENQEANEGAWHKARQAFETAAGSLKIVDFGLFA